MKSGKVSSRDVRVSIAKAILGGFKRGGGCPADRGWGVSIAKAILGGFKPMSGGP